MSLEHFKFDEAIRIVRGTFLCCQLSSPLRTFFVRTLTVFATGGGGLYIVQVVTASTGPVVTFLHEHTLRIFPDVSVGARIPDTLSLC